MSQAPKNPEMYELVTDWIIENPNRPLTSKGIAEAFGEDAAAYGVEILGRIWRHTLTRLAGRRFEKGSLAAICLGRIIANGGVMYRIGQGRYFYDATARVEGGEIVGNAKPIYISAHRVIPTGPRVGVTEPTTATVVPSDPTPTVEPASTEPTLRLMARGDSTLVIETDDEVIVATIQIVTPKLENGESK